MKKSKLNTGVLALVVLAISCSNNVAVSNSVEKETAATKGNAIWQAFFGGSRSEDLRDLKPTPDGGFIVIGGVSSPDGDMPTNDRVTDFGILKLDSKGKLQWQKTFGGSGGDEPNAVVTTADGGYIVAGRTNSTDGDITLNHGANDAWIIKLDKNGNVQWQKTFGTAKDNYANAIQQTADGKYIVAGMSAAGEQGSDFWIFKLDTDGNMIWEKTYGGSHWDAANSIAATADNGMVVAGDTKSPDDGNVSGNHAQGYSDFWVIKLDAAGNLQWQKALGGSSEDVARVVFQANDGGYVVGGLTQSQNGDVSKNMGGGDCWIVWLDTNGAIRKEKTYGGSMHEEIKDMVSCKDGGYLFAARTISNDGDIKNYLGGDLSDCWVVKVSGNGMIQWQKSIGGTDEDQGDAIAETHDGKIVIGGRTASTDTDVIGNKDPGNDFWIIKLK